MTVHGSKGLQAPIVILADAAGNPDASPVRAVALQEELPGGKGRQVPLPALRKSERAGPVLEAEAAASAAEREEHWRLLYVAMTRAEEALFIGGALGKRETEPAPDSWYARLAPLFGDDHLADPIWSSRREWGALGPKIEWTVPSPGREDVVLPDWATTVVGPEPRPPRPLAPSAAGTELGADPPLAPDLARVAARRGVLIHRLLERLPDVPLGNRPDAAYAWLARQAYDLDVDERAEIVASALAVLDQLEFAEVFSASALAEVPLAATVGGQVIAGTADRLLIEPHKITVVDFKTARRPPATLEAIPESTLRQMAAYAAALEVIYPGREIGAAVLYTQGPRLFAIPREVLADRKALLSGAAESFPRLPVE